MGKGAESSCNGCGLSERQGGGEVLVCKSDCQSSCERYQSSLNRN